MRRCPPVALAAAVDAALVLAFAAIGQSSHDESGGVGGVLRIAWPFLVGAGLGWVLSVVARRGAPLGVRRGLLVWIGAVGLGGLLRYLTGGGIAVTFVIVTGVTLAVFLLGWRALWTFVTSRDRRGTTSAHDQVGQV